MKNVFSIALLCVAVLVCFCCQGASHQGDQVTADSAALQSHETDTLSVGEAQRSFDCYMINHDYEGGMGTFVLEQGKGWLQVYNSDKQETMDKYLLRVLSYEEQGRENTQTEKHTWGHLVVNAYNPQTEAYAGQFDGTYDSSEGLSDSEEGEWAAVSYTGRFTHADGTVEPIEFYAD